MTEQASGGRVQAQRAGVGVHEERGDQERDPEEGHDPDRSRRDVADDLGEPDDVHVHVHVQLPVRVRLATDAFELVRHLHVVETLTGVGVKLLQLGADDCAAPVVRHEAPDDARLDGVLAHSREAGLARLEVLRQHVAGGDAVLHHLDEAHVRREDGEDLGAVHPGQEEGRVGHFAQRREELGREHVALARHERDDHPIRAAELVAVLDEGPHVLVLEGHQLGKAGIDAQTRSEPGHGQGGEREGRDDETAPSEEQVLEARAHDSRPPDRCGRYAGDARRVGPFTPSRAMLPTRRT